MPSDDLILNLQQIAGFPPATGNALSSDMLVMQRGGLGGPYVSISPTDLVSTALANGGSMSAGGTVSAPLFSGGSGQFSNVSVGLLDAQTANVGNLTATWGTIDTLSSSLATLASAQLGSASVSGDLQVGGTANLAAAVVQTSLTVGGACAFGYLSVAQTLDAANLNVSNLADVCNLIVNGNFAVPNGTATIGGYPIVTTANSAASGLAPLNSPVFTGTPMAPTPPLNDASNALATTAFVIGAVDQLDFAPLNSPNFSGVPSGPTAVPGTSTPQLATTAFVQAAITGATAGVSSFNTRTGAVTLAAGDLTAAGGALLASPVFTGTPTGPTPATADNSTRLATTAFVHAAVQALNIGVSTFNARTGAVTLTSADITAAGGALAVDAGVTSFNGRSGAITLTANDVTAAGALANPSPVLTGTPTAPTAAPSTSTTQLATTAFVMAAVAAVAGVTSFNGRGGAVAFLASDITSVGGALLASPAFTGTPSAPTAAPSTNTTQLATCAFVTAAIASGVAGVSSFNTRTGAVTLTSADITNAGGALASQAGVSSFNSRTGAVTFGVNDLSAVGGALLASPVFTGTPTAPTAAPGVSTTQLATTAFVANYLPLTGGEISGQLAIGVAMPSPSQTRLLASGSISQLGNGQSYMFNCYYDGTNYRTITAGAAQLIQGNSNGSMVFYNSPTGLAAGAAFAPVSFLTVAGNGAMTVGSLTSTSALNVSGSATVGGNASVNGNVAMLGCQLTDRNTPSQIWLEYVSGGYWFLLNQAGATYAQINPGGGCWNTTGTWNALSDPRVKADVQPYESGLSEILALDPILFRYTGEGGSPDDPEGTRRVGLDALATQAALPDAVSSRPGEIAGEPTDVLGIDSGPILYALVNAVKALAEKLTALETRMAT